MSDARPIRRLAVLWSHLSGYLEASLRACAKKDVAIFASWFRAGGDAPFADDRFAWLRGENGMEWDGSRQIDGPLLLGEIDRFQPDALLISGWNHPAYRAVARAYRGRAKRILCMDNPWEETPRKWLGRTIAPFYIRPLFDGAFVAGERQYQFARRLGFGDGEILSGLYAPDADPIRAAVAAFQGERSGFLFVGRLAPEKGVATLAEAYRQYRAQSSRPWPLTVVGTGALAHLLDGIEGATMAGFVQPGELPAILARHRCLVVPSLREPWGVQISEGATAGLAIIATKVCGAAVHLVREGFNGHLVPAADPGSLGSAMKKIEENPAIGAFQNASCNLARQFSTNVWVANLLATSIPRMP